MFDDVDITSLPEFLSLPEVTPDVDCTLANGNVIATVCKNKSKATIIGWLSLYPGNNYTNDALDEIKSVCPIIDVDDAITITYWEHQKSKGRVTFIDGI